MSKLDKLEAKWDGIDNTVDGAVWAKIYVPLLIRAVRQFGAEPKAQPHVNQRRVYWDGEQYRPIDSDVLDLIASNE